MSYNASDTRSSQKTPVHLLGVSQIIAYGLLFYAFAPLKIYLASASGLEQSFILSILSASLVLQAILMPIIGSWCDRIGALHIMRSGFFVGAAGMFGLGLVTFPLFQHWIFLSACFMTVGIGLAMCTYEMAFSAAVQLNEVKSRRNISIITFYGGIASSLAWISIHPLLSYFGLFTACTIIAIILAGTGFIFRQAGEIYQTRTRKSEAMSPTTPFSWSKLTRTEKGALILLSCSGACEYILFAATTLLWISWFELKFDNLALAVILASTYGPFQTIGRFIEMVFGHKYDARLTGLIACLFVPCALICVLSDALLMSFVGMALFGMGHGVLTVSYGFITNLYFRAEIYGRAKAITAIPRVFGAALGPSLGGILFALNTDLFISAMVGLSICATCFFASLLFLKPTNEVHFPSHNAKIS